MSNITEATILTGPYNDEDALIPRIPMIPTGFIYFGDLRWSMHKRVQQPDEILDPYVCPYAGAIGNDFILMDDNARPHRAVIVEEYLESWFGANGMASLNSRLKCDKATLRLSW
ncbi:hypothetical protein TNCV_5130321 [Trichonephila clavipes]|nr:hypothetical protein TNCV_5130321 [Trichonephila clavipes]